MANFKNLILFLPLFLLSTTAFAEDDWPAQCKKYLNIEARESRMGPSIDRVDHSCINQSGIRKATQLDGKSLQFYMTLSSLRGGPGLEFYRHGENHYISLTQPSLDGRIQKKELVLDSQCELQSVSWEWRDEKTPYRQLNREDCARKAHDVFEERSEEFRSTRYYCSLYELPVEAASTSKAAPSTKASTTKDTAAPVRARAE